MIQANPKTFRIHICTRWRSHAMLLLSEKRNRCPACTTGPGSSCHGPLRDICTFQQTFEKNILRPQWLFRKFEAWMVASKIATHHNHFQELGRQRAWIQQNNSFYEHWGAGVWANQPQTLCLVLCKGTLAAADGQNLVNHPHWIFVCCHVAHGAHKTEPEGLAFLFCFVSIPRRRFS